MIICMKITLHKYWFWQNRHVYRKWYRQIRRYCMAAIVDLRSTFAHLALSQPVFFSVRWGLHKRGPTASNSVPKMFNSPFQFTSKFFLILLSVETNAMSLKSVCIFIAIVQAKPQWISKFQGRTFTRRKLFFSFILIFWISLVFIFIK